MALDADRALDLLVEQRHVIPAASVVAQLQAAAPVQQDGGTDPRFFLHRYLAALFEKDPTDGGDYHALMVQMPLDPVSLIARLLSLFCLSLSCK